MPELGENTSMDSWGLFDEVPDSLPVPPSPLPQTDIAVLNHPLLPLSEEPQKPQSPEFDKSESLLEKVLETTQSSSQETESPQKIVAKTEISVSETFAPQARTDTPPTRALEITEIAIVSDLLEDEDDEILAFSEVPLSLHEESDFQDKITLPQKFKLSPQPDVSPQSDVPKQPGISPQPDVSPQSDVPKQPGISPQPDQSQSPSVLEPVSVLVSAPTPVSPSLMESGLSSPSELETNPITETITPVQREGNKGEANLSWELFQTPPAEPGNEIALEATPEPKAEIANSQWELSESSSNVKRDDADTVDRATLEGVTAPPEVPPAVEEITENMASDAKYGTPIENEQAEKTPDAGITEQPEAVTLESQQEEQAEKTPDALITEQPETAPPESLQEEQEAKAPDALITEQEAIVSDTPSIETWGLFSENLPTPFARADYNKPSQINPTVAEIFAVVEDDRLEIFEENTLRPFQRVSESFATMDSIGWEIFNLQEQHVEPKRPILNPISETDTVWGWEVFGENVLRPFQRLGEVSQKIAISNTSQAWEVFEPLTPSEWITVQQRLEIFYENLLRPFQHMQPAPEFSASSTTWELFEVGPTIPIPSPAQQTSRKQTPSKQMPPQRGFPRSQPEPMESQKTSPVSNTPSSSSQGKVELPPEMAALTQADATAAGNKAKLQVMSKGTTCLVFGIGEETQLAIPLSVVEQIQPIHLKDSQHSWDQGWVIYHSQIVPLLRLEQHLFLSSFSQDACLILCRTQQGMVGVLASHVINVVNLTKTTPYPVASKGISGTLTVDGRSTHVLNMDQLVRAHAAVVVSND